jgi:DNA-binding NarL/FixJ family response regulator
LPRALRIAEVNGADAAFTMKKALPEVPIILFTMYGENIGRYLTSAAGVDVVLCKQDGLAKLGEAVDHILGPDSPPQQQDDSSLSP